MKPTKETPYRPQVGDMAEFNTQRGTGVISAIIGSKAQLYCDGVWVKVDMSDLQLISRADGVPVETTTSEKMQQEHAAEVAVLKRDLEITRNERNQARLTEEKKWSDVVKSMQAEVDELRRQLAEKTAECDRLRVAGRHSIDEINSVLLKETEAGRIDGIELLKRRQEVVDLRQRLERAVKFCVG